MTLPAAADLSVAPSGDGAHALAPAPDEGATPIHQLAAPVLEVLNLSKTFPSTHRGTSDVEVMKDVSLTVRRGDICALLGPSGSGKSTLLRIVAGLESTSAGEALMQGKRITGPGRDRGMVFQSYTSFPWRTVRRNVEYGLEIASIDRRRARATADYFIEMVHLEQFRDAYPSQLSGGMRQRVALARALAAGPQLLLMDEPFGALDADTRWRMQELLLEIVRKNGLTVLIVTHDVEEALLLADQIAVFSSRPGRILEELRPDLREKSGGRKEDMVARPDYARLHAHLLRLLRAQHKD